VITATAAIISDVSAWNYAWPRPVLKHRNEVGPYLPCELWL